MKRPTIRLIDHNGVFLKWITPREAETLESKCHADRVMAKVIGKKKRRGKHANQQAMTYKLKPPVPIKRSMDEASPPSITRADMDANVGITEGLGQADVSRIRAARRKIRHFHPHRTTMSIDGLPVYFTHLLNDGIVLRESGRVYVRDLKTARKFDAATKKLRENGIAGFEGQFAVKTLQEMGILFDEVKRS